MILDQFPMLSERDLGAVGESGLDPMGTAAIADRLADTLAPGIRNRMVNPRFVTLTAIDATLVQALQGVHCADGKTTSDLVCEWMVVEAAVRSPESAHLSGSALPGQRKASQALHRGDRLSAATYLKGPRVFGFTGVYRPFSIDAEVIDDQGLPGRTAGRLLDAWEVDNHLSGYQLGVPDSPGGILRVDLERIIERSLRKARCDAPMSGTLHQKIVDVMAPGAVGARECAVLRDLIDHSAHEFRDELVHHLTLTLSEVLTEREVVQRIRHLVSPRLAMSLDAVTAYETFTSLLDRAFRSILERGGSHPGGLIKNIKNASLEPIAEVQQDAAPRLQRCLAALEAIDPQLADRAANQFQLFAVGTDYRTTVETILEHHRRVQDTKAAVAWIEVVKEGHIVRPAYRNQSPAEPGTWSHPMRINTLRDFLARVGA